MDLFEIPPSCFVSPRNSACDILKIVYDSDTAFLGMLGVPEGAQLPSLVCISPAASDSAKSLGIILLLLQLQAAPGSEIDLVHTPTTSERLTFDWVCTIRGFQHRIRHLTSRCDVSHRLCTVSRLDDCGTAPAGLPPAAKE